MVKLVKIALALAAVVGVSANDNGKARTPPLGWRSWNLFGHHVNQPLIESIMDGMLEKKRMVDGVPTSLCDLGYCDVGLDDYWQEWPAGRHAGRPGPCVVVARREDEEGATLTLVPSQAREKHGRWKPILSGRAGWKTPSCLPNVTWAARRGPEKRKHARCCAVAVAASPCPAPESAAASC
jgi:hypothetical protein